MQKVKAKLLGFVMYLVYVSMRATWRVTTLEAPGLSKLMAEKKLFAIALWHGEEIPLIQYLPIYKAGCMVSMSFDGEAVATMINMLGSPTARGSSSRGSFTGLKGLLRMAKAGYRPAITVDGPKGPRHVVKPGIVEVAKLLKLPICPVGSASSKVKVNERSWNKGEIPLPFSRVVAYWGEPIYFDDTKTIEEHLPIIAAGLHTSREKAAQELKKLEG